MTYERTDRIVLQCNMKNKCQNNNNNNIIIKNRFLGIDGMKIVIESFIYKNRKKLQIRSGIDSNAFTRSPIFLKFYQTLNLEEAILSLK